MDKAEYKIFIVITQSGSCLSKLLKVVTRAPYNHVSLSLKNDLCEMYSFGRLKPRNPVVGGFVMESPHSGTFARFDKTKAVVLCKPVSKSQYFAIERHLKALYNKKEQLRYDVLGLLLAALKIKYTRKNKYYCSEWVKEMMLRHGVARSWQFERITKPIHFLKLNGAELIFKGRLQDFAAAPAL